MSRFTDLFQEPAPAPAPEAPAPAPAPVVAPAPEVKEVAAKKPVAKKKFSMD
jgi:hypothetical protein